MDKTNLQRSYKWLIFLCFFAYAVSYIGRQAYNTNITNVITDYSVSKQMAGYVSSAFFFCYGIGQFINGIICGKLDSKWVIGISLVISGCISLAMFFVSNIIVMTVLWGLNGLILSTLWCNSIELLSSIKDDKLVNKAIISMALSLPIGMVVAYGLSSLLTFLGVWKVYYLVAVVALIACGVFFLISTLAISKKINKFSVEEEIEEGNLQPLSENTQQNDKKSLLKVVGIAIIPIFFMCVFTNIIKDGVTSWLPSFLIESFSLPDYASILITLLLPLFGVFASILSTFVYNKTKKIFISQLIFWVPTLLIIGVISIFIIFNILTVATLIFSIIIFTLISLFTHAMNNIFTSILPLHFRGRLHSGRTAGILNCFCYVGSTVSTFGLGWVQESFGWTWFLIVLLALSVLAIGFSIFGRFAFKREK